MNNVNINGGNPFTTCQNISQKRSVLCKLSAQAKSVLQMQDDGSCVNDILLEIYKDMGKAQEFHTFRDWKAKGKSVRKGSKAWVIWSKPRTIEKTQEVNGKEVTDKTEFYGLAFLFSDKQVN